MAPLDLITRLLRVVGHVFLTVDRILITDEERAVVAITLLVIRLGTDTPGALRIDLADEFQVHLVADGEVIAAVAQIEATLHLVTVGRHDQTAGITLSKGEEAVRNGQRQGHVGHHKVGRTEDHILARAYLGSRHRQIEVRVRVVTGGIASVLQEHVTVAASLGDLTGQVTVVLLGIDTRDKTFLRLEVEGHRVALIRVGTHLEDGRSRQFVLRGVHHTRGMHEVTVETQVDLLAGEVHVLVFHLRVTIEVRQTRRGTIGQRVVGRIFHRRIDTVLAALVDTVLCQRVVDGLVMLIDSQLDGVHRRGVALQLDCSLRAWCQECVCRQGISHVVPARSLGVERKRYLCHHQHDGKQHQKQS